MSDSPYIQHMNWKKLIHQIITLEPDPEINWTYETLGKAAGASRGIIERLLKEPGSPRYLEEPKWSQGQALIRIRNEIHEKLKKIKDNEANT